MSTWYLGDKDDFARLRSQDRNRWLDAKIEIALPMRLGTPRRGKNGDEDGVLCLLQLLLLDGYLRSTKSATTDRARAR